MPWGLYPLPGFEGDDYSLPFAARAGSIALDINHTVFLGTLIFALKKTETPVFTGLSRMAEALHRIAVPEGKKLNELTKPCSFPSTSASGKSPPR